MLKHYHDRYKTQEICDKAIDDFLRALNFFTNLLATSKVFRKILYALFVDDDILCFDKDSGNVTFSSDEIGNISVDLNNINLDDIYFNNAVSEIIISVRLLA